MIPDNVSKYFWDVDKDKISKETHAKFIIERVLEYGDLDEFRWINENYERRQIVDVIKNSRKLSPKSGNYFALYYDIPKEELLCIQKPFTQKQNRF